MRWARAFLIVTLLAGSEAVLARTLAGASVTAKIRFSADGAARDPDNSNVVLWLNPTSGAETEQAQAAWRALPRRYRLVQHHKQFTPHLLIVPAGSAVDFPNNDPFFHNVFSLFDGKRFDLGLYEAGSTRAVKFDHPGVSFIFCNIHPEMSAVVVALETPYFGVSSRSGAVTIAGVPPGRYRLELWSERSLPEQLKELSRDVEIASNGTSLGQIQLKQAGQLLAHHKNLYGREYDTTTSPGAPYQP